MHKSVVYVFYFLHFCLCLFWGPHLDRCFLVTWAGTARQQDFSIGKLWSLLSTPRNPG